MINAEKMYFALFLFFGLNSRVRSSVCTHTRVNGHNIYCQYRVYVLIIPSQVPLIRLRTQTEIKTVATNNTERGEKKKSKPHIRTSVIDFI